ncbi:MAG: hypothetical protein V1663_04590 [archaeon]
MIEVFTWPINEESSLMHQRFKERLTEIIQRDKKGLFLFHGFHDNGWCQESKCAIDALNYLSKYPSVDAVIHSVYVGSEEEWKKTDSKGVRTNEFMMDMPYLQAVPTIDFYIHLPGREYSLLASRIVLPCEIYSQNIEIIKGIIHFSKRYYPV